MTSPEELRTAELIESLTVALLSVRNAKGKLIPVPDPIKYAKFIAADLRSLRAPASAPASPPA